MRISTPADSGSIVVGWLVKLVTVFAVLGVLLFDGVSVGVARLAVTDSAAGAARAASLQLGAGGTAQQAYQAATDAAEQEEVLVELPVEEFLLAADGSVTLTVRQTAPTMVLHHVPGLQDWLVSQATASHQPG